MRRIFAFALLTTATIPMGHAFAADAATPEECAGPCLIYEGTMDLKGEWLHPSDAAINDTYILLPSAETGLRLKATNSFSIIGNIVSEQVIDPEPGKNQIFDGLGTYVDVLQAQYDFENVSLWAGKNFIRPLAALLIWLRDYTVPILPKSMTSRNVLAAEQVSVLKQVACPTRYRLLSSPQTEQFFSEFSVPQQGAQNFG